MDMDRKEIEAKKKACNEDVVDTLDYRGYHVDFYNDDYGQQVYALWEGQELGFGTYNTMYKDDMQCIIDDKLDSITRFEDTGVRGAQLRWFDNCGFRDVRLTYRLREIAVYLADGDSNLLPGILTRAERDLSSHVQSDATKSKESKRIAENAWSGR